MTSCIGAACLPRHASTAEQLMQCSGIALSHAKQPGRHWRIFDGEMAERLHRREQLKRRLAVAISEQRLTLHYQPQIELASGRLIGAEALCRWQDEEWGWISPAEFVPLAERHGLIETLGRQVILQGCRQLAQWQAAGHPLPGRLSINLSAGQLDDPRLVERLLALTQGIAPSRLGFEITETALMRAPEQATRITRALRGLGYALAIDDFGIGYSSLNYLKRLAADTLKIDIAFVRDMLVDRQDHAIVATIIAMARTLGMRTVAEGVEQQAQVEALRELGCDGAQGYCFGRPVDADAFARLWLTG